MKIKNYRYILFFITILSLAILIPGCFGSDDPGGDEQPPLPVKVVPGGSNLSPNVPTVFKNKLYFYGIVDTTDYSRSIFVYDGTNEPVKAFDLVFSGYLPIMTVFNGKLYFSAEKKGVPGIELYEYDGINTPTVVFDINSYSSGSKPNGMIVYKDKLYFAADHETDGKKLYVYDGLTTPEKVFDSSQGGTDYISPGGFVIYNEKLYYSVSTASGYALCSYNGTDNPDTATYSGIDPKYLTVYDGALYFAGVDLSVDCLYSFDEIDGLEKIQDLKTIKNLHVFKDNLFFSSETSNEGIELWKYNSIDGAVMISDLYPGTYDHKPSNFCTFNDKLYYVGENSDQGRELWVYDGINLPQVFADIVDGKEGSYPSKLTEYSGKLYFLAKENEDADYSSLWVME